MVRQVGSILFHLFINVLKIASFIILDCTYIKREFIFLYFPSGKIEFNFKFFILLILFIPFYFD